MIITDSFWQKIIKRKTIREMNKIAEELKR